MPEKRVLHRVWCHKWGARLEHTVPGEGAGLDRTPGGDGPVLLHPAAGTQPQGVCTQRLPQHMEKAYYGQCLCHQVTITKAYGEVNFDV